MQAGKTTTLRVDREYAVAVRGIAVKRWLKVGDVTHRLLKFGIQHADEIFPEPMIIYPEKHEQDAPSTQEN
jgi:hypothetical protein